MKLLFDLPDLEKKLTSERLGDENILYCTPTDLSPDGKLCKGWVVVTASMLITIREGRVIDELKLADGKEYKAVSLVGNGTLEAIVNNEPVILARYTMRHVPRYAYIARILSTLATGGTPKVKNDNDEGVCPKCGRVLGEGSKVCTNCINKSAVMKKLVNIVKPYWPLLLFAVLLFWAVTGLQLVTPYIYRVFIDDVLIPQKKSIVMIVIFVGAIMLSQLLNTLISIVRGRVMIKVGSRLSADLRAMVYNKIQALSLNYLNKRKTGDLMNRITNDTNIIRNFVQEQSVMAINQMLTLTGICIILFVSNWKLALMVILPTPIVLLLQRLGRKKIHAMYHKQWKVGDKANSLLQDILSGIRIVKAFGQEEREVKRFKKASRSLANVTGSNEKAWNTIFPALGFLMGAGQFLVTYYGSRLVLGEEMQLGELVQFTQYVGMLYGPLNWISFIPRWLTEAMTSVERVFEIIDEDPDVKDSENAHNHRINGQVTFNNVTFGYQSHEPVLEDISLDVKPGEMIGLVGHSGAGKSTLINLVLRFYDVDDGQILIDGVDIKDITQQDLRSQIGVVLQETFLFSGSVLDNIKYSKPDATPEEVIMAAKVANAHDFIMKFPDGYDTRVGENGHTLSGGERQRIAIARAILHNPRILILDEATASLDTDTEQQIQEALGRLVKNRTTFAIAHRLSTLRNANRLLVIDKGKKAELGTHDELLKAKGIYFKLVMAQRQMSKVPGEGNA